MADAWTTLLEHSAITPAHDAWEHLSNQEGGGSGVLPDCYGAKLGLTFSTAPNNLGFSIAPASMAFQLTPSNFDFSASDVAFTLELSAVKYTFNFQRRQL